ncbi:hypothetical protein L1049_019473 [Liquidambar formosana]|uniref:Uncharacterized protein n=1 Tax=Liquidambar formosana TaxID=63359 RepID=A0AAP0S5Y1_LIQFO
MGKKTKKPRKAKEKTERKTAKAEETRARRDTKKISLEEDIDAILVVSLRLQTKSDSITTRLLDVGPENKSMGTTKFERVSMSTLRHRMKEVLLNSILQQTIGTDSYKEILSDIWRLIESFLLLLCSGKK